MNLIVNVNLPGWGIGFENSLLVHISADLMRFAALTTGNTVICGRKTLQTFPGGKPLKNRTTWILSGTPGFRPDGTAVYPTLDSLLAACRAADPERLWVIGGASVYAALLPYCRTAYLTRTFQEAEADAFFPDLDKTPGWQLLHEGPVLEENGLRYQFAEYLQESPLPL